MIEVKPYTPVVIIDGRRVKLSPLEHRLMQLLVEHKGQLINKARLLSDVWDWSLTVERTRTVDQAIMRLRRKVPEVQIVNVKNVGWGIVEVIE